MDEDRQATFNLSLSHLLKGGFAEYTEGSGQHQHVMVLPQNEIKGDVGMSHHEKESNKKIQNPVLTSLFLSTTTHFMWALYFDVLFLYLMQTTFLSKMYTH